MFCDYVVFLEFEIARFFKVAISTDLQDFEIPICWISCFRDWSMRTCLSFPGFPFYGFSVVSEIVDFTISRATTSPKLVSQLTAANHIRKQPRVATKTFAS